MLAQPIHNPLPVVLIAAALVACAGDAGSVTTPNVPVAPTQPTTPTDTVTPANPGANLTYRYNAKFEPPMGRVVHGLGQWQAYNTKYAALFPVAHQPESELLFLNPVDTTRPWNPPLVAAAFAVIDARGRFPLADFTMHRSSQPTPQELAVMPDPLYGLDHEIANTTQWDVRSLDLVNVGERAARRGE